MSGLLNAGLAYVLLHTRKLDRYVGQAQTAIEVDPTMVLSYWTLGKALEQRVTAAKPSVHTIKPSKSVPLPV
jgi:hypothetical protein